MIRVWEISKDDLVGLHLQSWWDLRALSWDQLCLNHWNPLLVLHQALQGPRVILIGSPESNLVLFILWVGQVWNRFYRPLFCLHSWLNPLPILMISYDIIVLGDNFSFDDTFLHFLHNVPFTIGNKLYIQVKLEMLLPLFIT